MALGAVRLAPALGALFLLLLGSKAQAVDLQKLVMPGPLVAGHAELEEDCSNCHRAFKQDTQRLMCLDCHTEVAEDIRARSGFHGRHPLASVGECRSCHADHIGRDADIKGLSDATFDHDQTDFTLLGAHTSADCRDCHDPEVARRDAPSDCYSCHESDDAHEGSLSTRCGDCHDSVAWSSTRFDHDETDFALRGKHAEAACVGCHVGGRYEGTPETCVSCHSIDDAHKGRFGTDCADCHDTVQWAKKSFDHERESGFALAGAHAKADCATCHREAPGKRKLPEDCSGCHATEDVHAGRFGSDCSDCHAPTKWSKFDFDHGRRTDFALRGAHADTACRSCHTGPARRERKTSACIDCHRADDVHQNELGENCASCHNEMSFDGRIAFDHDLTNFPLLGLHAMTGCESCHQDHTFQIEDRSCFACHEQDDRHERTLGTRCQDCHTPNAWDVWRFDHAKQTDFALHGRHESLACNACHTRPTRGRITLAQECIECHASDDIHRDGFGRHCNNCHGFEAWSPAELGRR